MMDKIIDRLFKRLAATYGADWDRSLSEIPIADTRTVWAHELGAFANSLGRIAWALDNLPERCPNVIQFRNLCRAAPSQNGYVEEKLAVEHNKTPISPEILQQLKVITDKPVSGTDMKAWARVMQKRHAAAERLNFNQIRCYRNALHLNPNGEQT